MLRIWVISSLLLGAAAGASTLFNALNNNIAGLSREDTPADPSESTKYISKCLEGYRMSKTALGGPHGDYFNDVDLLLRVNTSPDITTLTLFGSSRVDRTYAVYDGFHPINHGGNGGTLTSMDLASGESLVKVYACSGQKRGHTRVFYLMVTSSWGRTMAVGRVADNCMELSPPEDGWKVVGLWGRSGEEIDLVGVWGK